MNNDPDQPNDAPLKPNAAPDFWKSPEASDELTKAFLRNVEAFESAPETTLARLLIKDGIELPPPDSFTEASVGDKLWEVIHAMARHHHFLSSTDHLSDLQLYRRLWEDTLNEPSQDLSGSPLSGAWHIDLAGCGSEEDTQIWLRHYADKLARDLWASDFPDDPIPEYVDPPFARDQKLPKAPMH